MAGLLDLLRGLRELNGSDLHLAAGREPRIRRHGALEAVPRWPRLEPPIVEELLQEIATPAQWGEFQRSHDLDFAYG
ncbi:MAG TPA: type IV pili twitching motility protein PilT, partial [Thermoanaerobaculia bacterium]|nr:type IV pili twitching motility protein PilT [Thermoanaerobaculia bacterium]